MKVTAILATCGRHTLLERSVGMFLQQIGEEIGEGDHLHQPIYELLIYNNSEVPLRFDEHFQYSKGDSHPYMMVRLINNHLDHLTGSRYTNLGAIYRDVLHELEWEEPDLLVHWDDDDLFLPNHLIEGIKGYMRGGKKAYKPAKSYYRHPGGIQQMSNTLEPSIFVEYEHIEQYGYSLTTTDQHLQWVNPLVYENRIFVDENGPATLVYDWNSPVPTFKTSGNAGHPNNFNNYRTFSQDHGDRIITPWQKTQIDELFKSIGL